MTLAFDPQRCPGEEPVPAVPRDVPMIRDPRVPAPPADIVECDNPPITPLPPEPPCPPIEPSTPRVLIVEPRIYVISGSEDRTAIIWRLRSPPVAVRRLEAHQGPVRSVQLFKGAALALTSSDDQTAILWDTQTASPLAVLTGHTASVRSARADWFQANQQIVTGSHDGTVRLWSYSGTLLRTINHGAAVNAVAIVTSGGMTRLLSGGEDGYVRCWNAADGAQLWQFLVGAPVTCMDIAPNLVVAGAQSSSVAILDYRTGELVYHFALTGAPPPAVTSLAVTGADLAARHPLLVAATYSDKTLRVWRRGIERPWSFLCDSGNTHVNLTTAVGITLGGQWVFSADVDRRIVEWNPWRCESYRIFGPDTHTGPITSLGTWYDSGVSGIFSYHFQRGAPPDCCTFDMKVQQDIGCLVLDRTVDLNLQFSEPPAKPKVRAENLPVQERAAEQQCSYQSILNLEMPRPYPLWARINGPWSRSGPGAIWRAPAVVLDRNDQDVLVEKVPPEIITLSVEHPVGQPGQIVLVHADPTTGAYSAYPPGRRIFARLLGVVSTGTNCRYAWQQVLLYSDGECGGTVNGPLSGGIQFPAISRNNVPYPPGTLVELVLADDGLSWTILGTTDELGILVDLPLDICLASPSGSGPQPLTLNPDTNLPPPGGETSSSFGQFTCRCCNDETQRIGDVDIIVPEHDKLCRLMDNRLRPGTYRLKRSRSGTRNPDGSLENCWWMQVNAGMYPWSSDIYCDNNQVRIVARIGQSGSLCLGVYELIIEGESIPCCQTYTLPLSVGDPTNVPDSVQWRGICTTQDESGQPPPGTIEPGGQRIVVRKRKLWIPGAIWASNSWCEPASIDCCNVVETPVEPPPPWPPGSGSGDSGSGGGGGGGGGGGDGGGGSGDGGGGDENPPDNPDFPPGNPGDIENPQPGPGHPICSPCEYAPKYRVILPKQWGCINNQWCGVAPECKNCAACAGLPLSWELTATSFTSEYASYRGEITVGPYTLVAQLAILCPQRLITGQVSINCFSVNGSSSAVRAYQLDVPFPICAFDSAILPAREPELRSCRHDVMFMWPSVACTQGVNGPVHERSYHLWNTVAFVRVP